MKFAACAGLTDRGGHSPAHSQATHGERLRFGRVAGGDAGNYTGHGETENGSANDEFHVSNSGEV